MDFTENEENTWTDQNYIMEICESVMQLYNATLSGRGNCTKRGFRAKDLPKFTPFLGRPMNISSNKKNIRRNLEFFSVKNKPSCSWWRFYFCQHSVTTSKTLFVIFWRNTLSSESHSEYRVSKLHGREHIAIELNEFLVLLQAANFTPSNVTVRTAAWNIPFL